VKGFIEFGTLFLLFPKLSRNLTLTRKSCHSTGCRTGMQSSMSIENKKLAHVLAIVQAQADCVIS
jgi:hypothetical protein